MQDRASGKPRLILATAEIPFDEMQSAFNRAALRGCTERDYRLAGFTIRVRMVGDLLMQEVSQALAHLKVGHNDAPALTVELWDEYETGVAAPLCPITNPPEVQVSMHATQDGRYVVEHRPHAAGMLDRSANHIIASTRRADLRNLDERARPLHRLLATWLSDRGVQFVHAGLVQMHGRGMLFGGHGGAGKSTSAIAGLCAGHGFLSDDFLGLTQRSDGRYIGYGMFASCLLALDHMQRFPELEPYALPPNHPRFERKAVFYLNALQPNAMRTRTTIDAILLPRVIGVGETTLAPAAKSETLLAMAPTSIMLLPAPNAAALRHLAAMIQAVPCYHLNLGEDVSQIAPTVERLAAQMAGATRECGVADVCQTSIDN